MSKDKDYQLVVSSNKDVVDASLLYFHGDNIEYSDEKDIVTNIEFESIILSIKKNFVHHNMVGFVNK